MKAFNTFAVLLFSSVLFVACAHHRDVRAGADGVHSVIIRTDDEQKGSRDAISQANHFCKQSNRMAAFVEEKQQYTGDLDQKTYNAGKRITKVAQVVGGGVWAMGAPRESNVGGVVGLGGAAGDAALGDGYTVSMKFKCQ